MAVNEPTNVITDAITFLTKIHEEDVVTIAFIKRSTKEERIMKCTLNFNKIPKADRPASVNLKRILVDLQKNKLLRVYDVEKMGWRSIPINSVTWMTDSNNKSYTLKLV